MPTAWIREWTHGVCCSIQSTSSVPTQHCLRSGRTQRRGSHPLADEGREMASERRPSHGAPRSSTLRGLTANKALRDVASGSQTFVQTNKTTQLTREPSRQGWLSERALQAAAPGETKGQLDGERDLARESQGQKLLSRSQKNLSVKWRQSIILTSFTGAFWGVS